MSWDEYLDKWWNKMARSPLFPFGKEVFHDIDEHFRQSERAIEEVFRDITSKAPKELVRERKLSDGSTVKEMGPIVYGYSMTLGPDGKPVIREFGNVRPSKGLGKPSIEVKSEREPLVDVLEGDQEVKVVAEVPGVDKTDIKLYVAEDTLSIDVDTSGRRYHKVIELPTAVDADKTKSGYRNGILEVVLPKKKIERKPKGVPVKIE